MTLAAEHVWKEIQGLPPDERHAIWQELGVLMAESPALSASDTDFETALEEWTGCTARRSATARLLQDRQRERQRDLTELQARGKSRSHA